ncbi:MAG TPA: DUF2760 domain-containing protein [Bryobacteraceae bacterium]|nr:DUF2760 domain-containing protein [Bryobacteraceae bacterium]
MNRISLAFRSFFSILFGGSLAPEVAQAFGYSKALPVKTASAAKAAEPSKPAPPPKPQAGPSDGAVQMLALLQRDARLVDFLMEDVSPYTDAQVGAAIRDVQAQAREALTRYLRLVPVLDGVEGEFTPAASLAPTEVKFIGNVPADGKAPGGLLRHKGWKAQAVDLPAATPGQVIAPAELEIE